MNNREKDLYWFLTKTSAGKMLGAEQAGQRILEDEFDALGIDLNASLLKSTGVPEVQMKCKIKAKDVVFHAGKSDENYGKVYFSVDPSPQPKGFNLPNAFVSSFNSAINKKITSAPVVIDEFKKYKKYRAEKLKTLSPTDAKHFISKEEQNSEYANMASSSIESREEKRKKYLEEIARNEEKRKIQEENERIEKAKNSVKIWKEGAFLDKNAQPSIYFKNKDMNYENLPFNIKRGSEYIGANQDFYSEFDMIPLININGKMVNYQKITIEDKPKKILASGLQAKGVFNIVGGNLNSMGDSKRIHFAEGLSTSYAVHEITNEPVVFALNSNNLENVVKDFREKFPDTEFIIAADNDQYKEYAGNAGISSAINAATDNSAKITYPVFSDNERGTDWDDFKRVFGKDIARNFYLRTENSILLENVDHDKKHTYKELSSIKYSGSRNVWSKVQDFVLPEGVNTAPSNFLKRLDLVKKMIPDCAFKEASSDESKILIPLSGININEMDNDNIVNLRQINKLDKNSKNFVNDFLSEYLDKNRNKLNQMLVSDSLTLDSLSNEESKKILDDPHFLKKGSACRFETKIKEYNEFEVSFFTNKVSGSYNQQNKYICNIGDISRNKNESDSKEITIKGTFESSVISERFSKNNEKNTQSLKDSMETIRSRRTLNSFNIEKVLINGRKVDMNKFLLDKDSQKNVKNFLFSNLRTGQAHVVTSKIPDSWNVVYLEKNKASHFEPKIKKEKNNNVPSP